MNDGLLGVSGNTPLVRLSRLYPNLHFALWGKLEGCNIGGSIKDRPAKEMLCAAIARGEIGQGTTIIESTSGNFGVGLAQFCCSLGLPLICVVDPKTTQQNLTILRAYGVKLEMVSKPDPTTGEYLQARLNRVHQLLARIPNSYWPNQYGNLDNPRAHRRTLAEIVGALNGRLDYLFVTVSTCGTLRGCSEAVRQHDLATKIVAIDAVGSVIFGGSRAPRLIPGHGAGVRSGLFREGLANCVVHVDDVECILGCRRLVRHEGILAGGSSGAVVSGIGKVADQIPADSICAAILPDRGERYLDTIFNEAWIDSHFGSDRRLRPDEDDSEALRAAVG